MENIEMNGATDAFKECWAAAGRHLAKQVQGGSLSWLKVNLVPPVLEHLSFRIGNHSFFIRVYDVDRKVDGPGNPKGYRYIAQKCERHALLMPMRYRLGEWQPDLPGWGLSDPESGLAVNPLDWVSDEKLDMTEWELQDFAVQIVRDHIRDKLGFEIMSTNSNPEVNPSIWFVGESGGPEWVVVRQVCYPRMGAVIPDNLDSIRESCRRQSRMGHFASVGFANSEDAFDPRGVEPALPLWRGYSASVRFDGLIPLQQQREKVSLTDPDRGVFTILEQLRIRLSGPYWWKGEYVDEESAVGVDFRAYPKDAKDDEMFPQASILIADVTIDPKEPNISGIRELEIMRIDDYLREELSKQDQLPLVAWEGTEAVTIDGEEGLLSTYRVEDQGVERRMKAFRVNSRGRKWAVIASYDSKREGILDEPLTQTMLHMRFTPD